MEMPIFGAKVKINTKKHIHKVQRWTISFVLIIFVSSTFFSLSPKRAEGSSLQDQINQIDREANSLQGRISEIEGDIKEKQGEVATLRNQVALFDNDIRKKQLEIDKKAADIEKTNLQIKQTQNGIKDAEKRIVREREVLAEFIRALNYSDDTSTVELMLSDYSFSDILDNLQHIESVQNNVQKSLDSIHKLQAELEARNKDLAEKKTGLEKQKKELLMKQGELKGAKEEKEELLDRTKSEENNYQKLLSEAKSDYSAKQSEIRAIEERIRQQSIKYGEPQPYASGFVWPLPAGTGTITCGFHCAGYFPGLVHTGTDIGAPKGTPIYSATDGVVVQAGWSSNHGGYGYYVGVSSGNLLLLYGHMLEGSIPVRVGQSISKGTRIGSVGLTGFTSGYHLHFEIRQNGVPINAMQFY